MSSPRTGIWFLCKIVGLILTGVWMFRTAVSIVWTTFAKYLALLNVIVKLRSRSRAGEGQVKVRWGSSSELKTLKTWTWAIQYFLFVHIATSSLQQLPWHSHQLPHKLWASRTPVLTQPPAPTWTLKHNSSLPSATSSHMNSQTHQLPSLSHKLPHKL